MESNHTRRAYEARAAAVHQRLEDDRVDDPGLEPGVREAAALQAAGRPVVHVIRGDWSESNRHHRGHDPVLCH